MLTNEISAGVPFTVTLTPPTVFPFCVTCVADKPEPFTVTHSFAVIGPASRLPALVTVVDVKDGAA